MSTTCVPCSLRLNPEPKAQTVVLGSYTHTVSHSESSPSEVPPLQPNRNSSDMFCQLFIIFYRVKRTAVTMQVRKELPAKHFCCLSIRNVMPREAFSHTLHPTRCHDVSIGQQRNYSIGQGFSKFSLFLGSSTCNVR